MAQTEEITVNAILREGRGKNDSRRLRASGYVPLSLYGGGGESIAAAARLSELAAVLRKESGHNTIFTLAIEGGESAEVMFHERTIDPLKSRLIHADLKRLVRGQLIDVTVPVHLTGDPVGALDGGVLDQGIREIKVRCRPRSIPDAINVDVSGMAVDAVIHVRDLPSVENVEITEDPESVIATLSIPREEPLDVPVIDDATEPEVIGKGGSTDGDGTSDSGK